MIGCFLRDLLLSFWEISVTLRDIVGIIYKINMDICGWADKVKVENPIGRAS